MLDIMQFVFQDFWHWLGTVILSGVCRGAVRGWVPAMSIGDVLLTLFGVAVLGLLAFAVVGYVQDSNACKARGGVPVQVGRAIQVVCVDPKILK